MAIYGVTQYGIPVLYGFQPPLAYSVDPFTAEPYNYTSIELRWQRPAGTITAWRLIKNMQGFASDQDDGLVVIDSNSGFPGTAYADTSITPGAYHYYSFYVQASEVDNLWVNAGNAGCLMLQNYGSTATMLDLIPNFYIESVNNIDELQADPTGNPFLNKFMAVFGWGLDYLRTQYDTYRNVNSAFEIPVNDLYNLALELGLDINPAISPYTLRKAVFYNAVINKTKGTLQGLATELSALTGWTANLWIGPNLMLSNDQSYFQAPVAPEWGPNLDYNVGEIVQNSGYVYVCLVSPNRGNAPTGTSSSNTWWQVQQGVASSALANSYTGGIDTWEGYYELTPSVALPSNALQELTGLQDPIATLNNNYNALQITNLNVSTTDMRLRNISRTPGEIPFTNYPDKFQSAADGVPVPFATSAPIWDADTLYFPYEIVLYSNQPFRALRMSIGSVPPYTSPGTDSLDWEPLSYSQRLRIATSAYVKGSALAVTPFVEWYDSNGNVTLFHSARNNGTEPSLPGNLCFDSFVTGAGQTLASYTATDDEVYNWTTQAGGFSISPFANGCAYPSDQFTRSIVTVNTGMSDCQAGITFVTDPESGWATALLLRFTSYASYIAANMTQLIMNSGETYTVLGTYSTPCVEGDRLIVYMSGTAINCYRNGVAVLNVTTSFNETATEFGIIYERPTG